jgi:spermidine synthase
MPVVFREKLTEADWAERAIEGTLARGQTRFQSYHFWRSPTFGVCITLDGDLQSTEADVHTYHEALVHPAMLLHPNPRRVLICGGGEGATAREVLRHPCVQEVVMCDIDKEFVDLCRELVPGWSQGTFEDPRLEVRYEDIVKYIAEHEAPFDVVIGDLVDLAGDNPQVEQLYGADFFSILASRMTPEATLATQASALCPSDHKRHLQIRGNLQRVFGQVQSYRVTIPSFFSPWAFALTGQPQRSASELLSLMSQRMQERKLSLHSFDGPSMAAAFMLPPDAQRLLQP